MTRIFDNKTFTLAEDELTHNQAINLAHAYRRGQTRTLTAHGNSGYKRHLYRIAPVGKLWGIFVYKRNPRQY